MMLLVDTNVIIDFWKNPSEETKNILIKTMMKERIIVMKFKKLAVVLCTVAAMAAVTSCGGGDNTDKSDSSSADNQQEADNSAADVGAPVDVLTNVWGAFSDDEKFPIGGGDYSEENSVMDAPGKVNPTDTDYMEATFGMSKDIAEYVDDAASILHMMNANTFTAGAFHIADSANMDDFVSKTDEAIKNREWMCGFPEKFIIAKLNDSTVIMSFGEGANIDTLKSKISEKYSDAEFVVDRNIEE